MPANRKAQIERINQVSAMARTSWIALLGYLAFIGVTLLGVEDADFFVPSRQTQLPLVNVSIPTASFFIFAPILAAALYIYLHIILMKLWDAIADANTPRIDGHPLGDHLNPWLVNDWALTRKGPPYTPARPLLALGNAASFLLVWAAGPLVLFGFWWRSMPAHDEWLTLLLAACLLLSLHAALTSWRTARAWLARPRREPPSRPWWRSPPALAVILATTVPHLAPNRRRSRPPREPPDRLWRAPKWSTRIASDEEQEAWIAEGTWIPKLDWFDVTSDTPILGRWIGRTVGTRLPAPISPVSRSWICPRAGAAREPRGRPIGRPGAIAKGSTWRCAGSHPIANDHRRRSNAVSQRLVREERYRSGFRVRLCISRILDARFRSDWRARAL